MVFFVIKWLAAHDAVLVLIALFSHELPSSGKLRIVGTAPGTVFCPVGTAPKVIAAYDAVISVTADMSLTIIEFSIFF